MTTIVTASNTIIPNLRDKFKFDLTLGSARQLQKVRIIIEYMTVVYKETTLYKDFGMLSLWSQIGGFVGIFLGYSLLKLPELMKLICIKANDIIRYEKIGK